MKLYTSHLNNLEVQKKSELMWSCGHSAVILCQLYAHLIHMLNCFGCSQWWFVPVAVLLQRLGLISCLFCQVSAFVVSHYIITLCQMWRSGSDEFDQLQQEKFGFFLGASKLGSDRWWVFLSKVACFVTCLWRGKKRTRAGTRNSGKTHTKTFLLVLVDQSISLQLTGFIRAEAAVFCFFSVVFGCDVM